MNVVPFVHEGLGNSSYLVGIDGGEAILVDPDRSVQRYLDAAAARDWHMRAVLETHLHADFVSGAREVTRATGATLFLPEGASSRLPHRSIRAGERIRLEGTEIEALASPGHTPEHMSYVLRTGGLPPSLFSGGSLIVGGAARTDLIAPELTESLTRAQYRTLKRAFAPLPDETLLCPTHGGGSFCSAGASNERTSNLGAERARNPLLTFDDEDEFAAWFPTTFPAAPDYFFRLRAINQAGARLRSDVAAARPLSPTEVNRLHGQTLIVDVRPMVEYLTGHIPCALSIPFRDAYAVWLGWLVPPEALLLFVTGGVALERVVDESLLVGYERFGGWLEGGMEAWVAARLPVETAAIVDAAGARIALIDGALALDVREPDEYAAGHVEGAVHLPLGKLAARAHELPSDRPILAYCGHGERSTTALSILERAGRKPLLNLRGGIDAWRDAGYPEATAARGRP